MKKISIAYCTHRGGHVLRLSDINEIREESRSVLVRDRDNRFDGLISEILAAQTHYSCGEFSVNNPHQAALDAFEKIYDGAVQLGQMR